MEEVCWSIHYSNLSGYYWTPSKGWPLMAGPKSPRVLKLAHKEYPLSVLLVHHDVYTLQNYTWSQISWFPIWEFSLSKRYFASSILNFTSVTMCSLRVNVKFEQTSLISSYELFSMCTSSWNSKKNHLPAALPRHETKSSCCRGPFERKITTSTKSTLCGSPLMSTWLTI